MKIKQIRQLLIELKNQIRDEYRAFEDDDSDVPSMQITIATTDGKTWGWQTGDNSYTGGAYSFRHWHVLCLERRSNSTALAREAVHELRGMVAESEAEA